MLFSHSQNKLFVDCKIAFLHLISRASYFCPTFLTTLCHQFMPSYHLTNFLQWAACCGLSSSHMTRLSKHEREVYIRCLSQRYGLNIPVSQKISLSRANERHWDHLTWDHSSGILGMGEVSSLNCVYLLAPCHENLPINCILILSANFPRVFFALH